VLLEEPLRQDRIHRMILRVEPANVCGKKRQKTT
jgi:hypothetical protein